MKFTKSFIGKRSVAAVLLKPSIVCSLFVFISASGCRFIDPGPENTVTPKTLYTQLRSVDCDNRMRLLKTKQLFEESGADSDDLKIVGYGNVFNVVATINGKSPETIVVGAHYDKTSLGCGVIDNWAGVVILANLYKTFKRVETEKTFIFVAFGKEEQGLVGSTAMAKGIKNNAGPKFCVMINFDSFGFEPVWALKSISDDSLVEVARTLAKRNNQIFSVKDFAGASSDSASFRKAGIPAITFSGIDDNWREYLHRNRDVIEKVNPELVYGNFRFGVDYLTEMDLRECGEFHQTN